MDETSTEAERAAAGAIRQAGLDMVTDLDQKIENHDRTHRDFKERLWQWWSTPLALYFTAWRELSEIGGMLKMDSEADPDLREVLAGLHAKGTRVALEVFHLLRDGLPKAAAARARTLFELAVHSELIQADPRLAPRFLAYSEHQRHLDATGYMDSGIYENDFTPEEMASFKQRADEAEARHPGISKLNGWANLDGKGSTFHHLVQRTSLWGQYPHYVWFSHEVHGNARGGVLNTFPGPDGHVYFSGYTNKGLADPGQAAILCYLRITSDLLEGCGDDSAPWARYVAATAICNRANERFADVEQELSTEGLNLELSDIWKRPI
ncbi:hypothetical protein FOJ82_00510 [Tessaracoccus rhinocerotis]|uniref:Uncharacterized protein n=1 Tax=Tessaracoccus rhinocerotis TaxID=1689449 RepID=A0A553K427_9ACTN|nr:DUF5677 domain-containing protein [Tessaracoccus rhinocerotis]TRY19434.1 hypothetical protein FOJ82_00510 [Tessaracoccus rhinocerotis]